MLYITGDTHGYNDIWKVLGIRKLTKEDYLIITGDFGLIFPTLEKSLLNKLKRKKFTILFVDGNHEGFDCLNSYPVQLWNGGKVHKISDNIIHLIRGQVFEIENKTIFTFGGAMSIDKENRIEKIDWWREEQASIEELCEGIRNLSKYDFKVDFIITHTCREKTAQYICNTYLQKEYVRDPLSQYFECIYKNVEFKRWFFGHFHLDIDNCRTTKETLIYKEIKRLE